MIKGVMGDETFETYGIEYLITFLYLILLTNFLRLLKKAIKERDMQKFQRRKQITSLNVGLEHMNDLQNTGPNTSIGRTLMMILAKNSYRFSLAILYLIGMRGVSLFNMILVAFFIVFFIAPKYARNYWIWLVVYTNIVIFVRYFWSLGSIDIAEAESLQYGQWLNFIGITDTMEVRGVLEDQDTTTNDLFWALFILMLLQYDVYRSSTFKS